MLISLKLTYLYVSFLLFLPLFNAECIGQVLNPERKGKMVDADECYTDSLKNRNRLVWLRIKKKGSDKIIRQKNEVKQIKNELPTASKKINRTSVRRKIRKHNTGNKDVESLKTETDKAESILTEKTTNEKDRLLSVVPDSSRRDSLKRQMKEEISGAKAEDVLQKNSPVQDYKPARKVWKEDHGLFATKQRKVEIRSEKKKLTEHFGMDKISGSFETTHDTIKRLTVGSAIKQLSGNIKGSVSVGCEYGILPYVAPENYPSGGFKSEGRLSVSILNLPIEVMYRYTTIKSVLGINNYFRVSYDVDRYKEELDKKMVVREHLKKVNLDKLRMLKREIAMKMESFKTVSNVQLPYLSLPDTSLNPNGKWSTGLPAGWQPDSIKAVSLLNRNLSLHKRDSLLKHVQTYKEKYDAYKAKYDSISKIIEAFSDGNEELKKFNAGNKIRPSDHVSKAEAVLRNIKKFEIGLCNPSYSLFLVSNAPLKGVNFEYGDKDHFFAFTYGTTINSIFYNPNTIQGKLQEVRNFYNFFDFNDLSKGRKVLSLKGGRGQKEGTHLFVGILLGKGKMDYLTLTDPKFGKRESNVVVELDAKYKFSSHVNADIIAGKSSLQSEDLSMNQLKASFKEIFSDYRSNALQARINYDIQKTRTKIQLTGRWIDPYFKSFGVSFLRSDNIRYEIKADQQLIRNIKYTLAFRREEDNLLGLINYKNVFTTIQNSFSIRWKKGVSVKLNYAPLLRTLRNGDVMIKDRNSISTVILSYVPRSKHVQANYNLLYSKYRVTSDSGNIHFDNLTYSHQFQFGSGFKTGMNVSWFENTLKDTLNNNTYLGVVDMGYITKGQNSFMIGGKVAYKTDIPTEFGFIAKATLKIYKAVFWEMEAEKILTGDYYSTLIDAKIRRFPYYISNKLIINF